MAYNQYDPRASADYTEHLHNRYSDDPFAANNSAQPYSSLPLGQDPEMVDLSRERPVSDLASEPGSASAYWQPGARASTGAGTGATYLGNDDWVDGGAGQDNWWRRHRWAVIAAVLLVAALAIGLGVGLGVGLTKNKGKSNAAQLSDSRSSATDPPANSFSVGTVVFTSTSFGSGEPATITATSETSATVPDPTPTTSEEPPSSSSSPPPASSSSTTTPPPSSSTTTPPPSSSTSSTTSESSSSSSSSSESSSSSSSSTTTPPPSSSTTTPPDSSTTTPPDSSSSTTTSAPAGTSPPLSTDSEGGTYTFTTRPIINPGGFTIGTLTAYVTITSA